MSAILDEALRAKIQLAGAAAENADVLAALVRSKLDVRADGVVKVLDGAGNVRIGRSPDFSDMTLDEWISEVASSKPSLFGKASLPSSKPASASPVDEWEAVKVARAADAARQHQVKAPTINPFAKGSINVTAQVVIQARDPVMAARLKAEAGE